MSIMPLLETPNTTLLPLAHLLWSIIYHQLTYAHAHTLLLFTQRMYFFLTVFALRVYQTAATRLPLPC